MVATLVHPTTGQTVKLGRRMPDVVHPHLKLKNYMRAGLPVPPATLDLTQNAMPSLSKIMLNDQLGCCEISWHFGHLRGVLTAANGDCVVTSDFWIQKLYEVIGKYDPTDPSTDQGCMSQDVLGYMVHSGEALGYVGVNAADPTELRTAVWLFGAVSFGAGLPDAWVKNIGDLNWRVAGDPDMNNGHCFGCPGKYDGSTLATSTWGQIGSIDDAASAKYCGPGVGECWAVLSRDWIKRATGLAPNGFAADDLQRDLAALS